ncbi:MAG: STAS domain-containing protein [Candidatus Zixiibacteriota bacterium]
MDHNITQNVLSDDTIVINPGSVLDNNNAHHMVDIISRAQSMGYHFIMIDMSQLQFISSAGVGSILGAVETSRENGGDIVLCNVSESVLHILRVLDLTDFLTIRDDIDHAVETRG